MESFQEEREITLFPHTKNISFKKISGKEICILHQAFYFYILNIFFKGQATVLLEQLEREKELLRIFLRVSQNQNPILRRMPLNSFLMVPVQRIMRFVSKI